MPTSSNNSVSNKTPRQALILDGNNMLERAVLHNLREQSPAIHVVDAFEQQLRELVKIENPEKQLSEDDYTKLFNLRINQEFPERNGCWVYFPWRNTLVHCLNREEFIRVRTIRNRFKITDEEQERLSGCRVGIVGLSVGQSVAITLAMERIAGNLRIADFDTLELSNMNRIRTSLVNQGELKTSIVAREIAEIDPFLHVTSFDKGLLADNMHDFLHGLDVVVDECDNLEMKIMLRKAARELGIPVVMDTSDLLMLDVERYDLEPQRPIFHGLIDEHTSIDWQSPEERMRVLQAIIEPHKASSRAIESLQQIGKTITTWPQLATDVSMGGAFTAKIVREILLGNNVPSGRMRLNLVEHFNQNAEHQLSQSLKNA
jgi:molybdopterin/thiamine biosynthesis adenylyltransferase